MQVTQEHVEITIEIVNTLNVGPGESEMDESILNQIFGQLLVVAGHLHRPSADILVALNEDVFVRYLSGFRD